jgi:hypothetical protein
MALGLGRVASKVNAGLRQRRAEDLSLEQILVERAMRERQMALQEQQMKQQGEQFTARQAADLEDRAYRRQTDTEDRQFRIEDRQDRKDTAAGAQRQQVNLAGVRRMAMEGLGGGAAPDAVNRLMYSETGDTLPESMTADPNAALNDYEKRKQIDMKYLRPTAGPAPNYMTLAGPNGEQQRVPDGAQANALLGKGWKLHDAVAARQGSTNPDDARAITSQALDLAKRLKTHPGTAKAYGAYEMRGWTQEARDAKAIRDQLAAALAQPNLAAVRGPLSDKDILFVKQLSTRLNDSNISDEESQRAIDEAITFLQGTLGAGQPAPAGADGGGVQRWGRDGNGRPVRLQ